MAITKEVVIAKMEVVQVWNIQVATDTVIKEDGTEISRSRHRHVLVPFNSVLDTSDNSWTHTATDISGESAEVQAVANAIWTDTVKANFKTFAETQNK
mgnify:CR=1 FL=1